MEPPFGLDEAVKREVEQAVQHLVTEDDQPVDNPFSEKQQRLLTAALYSSWTPPPDEAHPDEARSFWAAASVGLFPSIHQPPLVPDVFVSLDVSAPEDWHQNRAYFFWEFGKAPELVIEIVSNRKGGELSMKRYHYARLGVIYYVVYDPTRQLGEEILHLFALQDGQYQPLARPFLPRLGLGLTLWRGAFENKEDTYLRWCDERGNLLLTGDERAERAEERAEQAEERAEQAEGRAERLAAKLRELGIDPKQL
jgi:Uma2 family endonuclease